MVVDLRKAPEVQQNGKFAGAVDVPRGLLEFVADPKSLYHDPHFDRDKTVIVYCASGRRAALAGHAHKDMGYGEVYNQVGFEDWADSGGAIDRAEA